MRRKLADISALVVGEGKAELVLLRHLKSLYLPQGCGTTLKVKGGFGKGGKGVLDYAISRSENEQYDRVIVLLDTDTNWDNTQRSRAEKHNIQVVESEPCLEAWLLAIHDEQRTLNTAQCKRAFEKRFDMEAHDERVYAEHFPKSLLDKKREKVDALNRVLHLFGV